MYRLLARLATINEDDGMSTIEYAVGSVAAAAFAAILLKVVSSPAIQKQLTDVIGSALK